MLRNCGTLPAQKARLSLVLHPLKKEDHEENEPICWEEIGVKALVPGEEGNYHIDLSRYPRFTTWREAHRDIVIDGRMVYMLDQTTYKTEFEATLRFGEELEHDGCVKTRWRNCEVI